eukprot:scaffold6399_cov21-Tisochrysis_lutea.AAC.5
MSMPDSKDGKQQLHQVQLRWLSHYFVWLTNPSARITAAIVPGLEELLGEAQDLKSRLEADPSSSMTQLARHLLLESRLISLGLAWSKSQFGSAQVARQAGPSPDQQAFAQIRNDLLEAEAAATGQSEVAHIIFCRLLLGRATWSEAVRECKHLVYNVTGAGRQGALGGQELQESMLAVSALGLLRQRGNMEQMVHDTQRVMKSVASSRMGEFVVELHSRSVLEGNMLFMACMHDPQREDLDVSLPFRKRWCEQAASTHGLLNPRSSNRNSLCAFIIANTESQEGAAGLPLGLLAGGWNGRSIRDQPCRVCRPGLQAEAFLSNLICRTISKVRLYEGQDVPARGLGECTQHRNIRTSKDGHIFVYNIHNILEAILERPVTALKTTSALPSRYWQDVLKDMNKSVLDVCERVLKRLRPTVAGLSHVLKHESWGSNMYSPSSVVLEALVASLLALREAGCQAGGPSLFKGCLIPYMLADVQHTMKLSDNGVGAKRRQKEIDDHTDELFRCLATPGLVQAMPSMRSLVMERKREPVIKALLVSWTWMGRKF